MWKEEEDKTLVAPETHLNWSLQTRPILLMLFGINQGLKTIHAANALLHEQRTPAKDSLTRSQKRWLSPAAAHFQWLVVGESSQVPKEYGENYARASAALHAGEDRIKEPFACISAGQKVAQVEWRRWTLDWEIDCAEGLKALGARFSHYQLPTPSFRICCKGQCSHFGPNNHPASVRSRARTNITFPKLRLQLPSFCHKTLLYKHCP